MMQAYHFIDVVRKGSIARIRLNRPNVRNALNLGMCEDLQHAFAQLSAEPDVHVILVEGEGSTFCAGADLKERVGKDATWIRERRVAAFAAYEQIEKCEKPVIACVHNHVIGSGGEIAMACDFIVASQDAQFSFPEPRWGTIGATQRLQRVIGKRAAKELLFTGRTISANEALHLGLVQRVVADLTAASDDIASRIAQAPPLTMALTKQAIDLGEETSLVHGVRIELACIDRNLAEGSWRKALDDFSAKNYRSFQDASLKGGTSETSTNNETPLL